jgi:hypothetical protein
VLIVTLRSTQLEIYGKKEETEDRKNVESHRTSRPDLTLSESPSSAGAGAGRPTQRSTTATEFGICASKKRIVDALMEIKTRTSIEPQEN